MRGLQTKRQIVYVLISALGLTTPGLTMAAESSASPAKSPPAQQGQFIDGIAAVVNKQVITLRQLDNEVKSAAVQLKQQKIQVPDLATLQKQVLQRMITEELVRQEADRLGVRVSDAEVDRAVRVVAERNRISLDTLKNEIAKAGSDWNEYRETLRREIRVDKLRQRAVDSQIVITDPEVRDPLRFLRAREIVHFQRFGEALERTKDSLNERNYYYCNPEFDKGIYMS